MTRSMFGLQLTELVAPAAEADVEPSPEEEFPEALLVRTLAQLAPEGNFSLRYLHDPGRPGELQVSLLGNVGTLIAFRVGVQDAALLENYFEAVGRQALAEQPNYHAYVRLLVEGWLTPPFSLWTELEPEGGGQSRERIIAGMRQYARPRGEVEEEIAEGLEGDERCGSC